MTVNLAREELGAVLEALSQVDTSNWDAAERTAAESAAFKVWAVKANGDETQKARSAEDGDGWYWNDEPRH